MPPGRAVLHGLERLKLRRLSQILPCQNDGAFIRVRLVLYGWRCLRRVGRAQEGGVPDGFAGIPAAGVTAASAPCIVGSGQPLWAAAAVLCMAAARGYAPLPERQRPERLSILSAGAAAWLEAKIKIWYRISLN